MVEIETLEEESKATTSDEWIQLMGDDLVMKVISKDRPSNNKDPEAVQPNDAVMIDFVGRLADDRSVTDGPIFQEVKGWFIMVGDGDVLPALELAIRFMDTGSTARVWSHSKYAFSSGTRLHETTRVPPNASVMFEVKVTQIVIDTSRLNPYFTLQKAVNRKTMANDIYQHEWCPPPTSETDPSCDAAMARALRLYQAAAKDMETLLDGTYFNQVEEDHPQRGQSTQILLDSLNNIVAVYLRQKEFHKAKQAAVEVLKQDPKNVKALLRAAKASLLDSASTMEEVEASLDAAEEEITYKDQQSEKELKRLKTELKRKKKEYKMKSKEMFADKLKTKASSEESAESSKKTSSTTETTKSGTSEEIQGTADTLDENSSEETKGEVAFWKSQLVPILIQVFIPLAIFLLYRFMSKANSIAQLSMASEDDDMSSAGEESGDTINLDL